MSTNRLAPVTPSTEPEETADQQVGKVVIPRWKRPFQVLEFPDFRHLWISTLPGVMGMEMSMTARGYLAYDLTGSAVSVGVVSLGAALPMLCLSLFGGVAADRFRKRNVLFFTQSLQCTAATLNAVLVLTGVVQIWHLAAVAILTGIGQAFNMPARQSFAAQLVPRDRIMNAVALHQAGRNFARIVGPAMAGGLIVLPFIGVGGTFVIIALFFFSVLINLSRIKNPGDPEEQVRVSPLRSIANGLSYVRQSPLLVTLLLLAFIPMFLGNPYQQLMPVFSESVFGVGAAGLGFLLAANGVGALMGSLAIASASGFARRGLLQMLLGMLFGGALLAFAFSPSYPVALVAIMVVGMSHSGYQSLNSSLVMSTAEPAFRGRVMSLLHVTNGAAPLAILPIGFLIDAHGAPIVIGLGGLLLLVLVFAMGTFNPAYKRLG